MFLSTITYLMDLFTYTHTLQVDAFQKFHPPPPPPQQLAAFRVSPILATYPAHDNLLHFTNLMIKSDLYVYNNLQKLTKNYFQKLFFSSHQDTHFILLVLFPDINILNILKLFLTQIPIFWFSTTCMPVCTPVTNWCGTAGLSKISRTSAGALSVSTLRLNRSVEVPANLISE
jgi:hypothetical protein